MIFYYKADDPQQTRYYQNKEFVCDGIRYSAGKATDDLFVSLGFTKVIVEPSPDPDYFVVTGAPDLNGVYPKVAKTLETVKAQFCLRQREIALQLLKSTDYLVVELAEARIRGINVTCPPALSSFRDAIRKTYTDNCAKIMAPTTTTELQSVMAIDYDDNVENGALVPYNYGEYSNFTLGTYLDNCVCL